MKLKKMLLLVLAVLMAAAVFAACSSAASADKPEWTITIAGADKAEFTSLDYAKLTVVKIDAEMKGEKQAWEGVPLKDVLGLLGVKEYTSITLEGSDGYKMDYSPDIANAADTILGTIVNGTALGKDKGYIQSVAASQPPKMWVRDLVKITVNK